jgi:hypothetical protein
MTAINRRAMLKALLGSAAVATIGLVLTLDTAESAPLTTGVGRAALPENPVVEKVAWVRRHRWVCRWHRGRRVCRWRNLWLRGCDGAPCWI